MKPRGILIAGNWKMNHGPRETEAFFSALREKTGSFIPPIGVKSVLFIPSLSLETAQKAAAPQSWKISIGAQNAHWENKGAYTGEISGPMLQEVGVEWVLIGHSERRQFFGETDRSVFQRTDSLLKQGFQVMTCIGETREQREQGQMKEVLSRQIAEGLGKLDLAAFPMERLVLAYEPVWAIGTGLNASPQQAQEAHALIRERLEHHFGKTRAAQTRVLYGGSVTPENVTTYLECPDVDGVLVGGASLKPEGFLALVRKSS